MSVNEKMTAIADAIREKTGEPGALSLDDMAESIPNVYEAGKEAEHKAFWDSFLPKSEIGYAPYQFAGFGWTNSNFRPNKDIVFINAANGAFRNTYIRNLKGCLENCGVTLDTSRATNLSSAFAYGYNQYLPKISLESAGSNIDYVFGEQDASNHLIWIDEVEVAETNTFKGSFNYNKKLTHCIFTGTLATNGLDLHWSNLDQESVDSIVNVLQDRVALGLSGTNTVTLSADSNAKLTDAAKATISQKGWSVAVL